MDFFDKQMVLEEKKRLKLQKLEQKYAPSHVPRINGVSRALCEADDQMLLAGTTQRLYDIPFAKQRAMREEMDRLATEKHSFQPKINRVSAFIAKQKTVEELGQRSGDKMAKIEMLRSEKAQREVGQCTFAPSINRNFKRVSSVLKTERLNDFLADLQTTKNFRETIAKKKEEFEELKHCVFKPKINQYDATLKTILHGSSVGEVVRGVDQFMSHVEYSKRLKAEQQQRERKAFNFDVDYDYNKHKNPTVPVPFKLSENRDKN
jgi:hypothetical protein